jgi:hypothetical protein
MSCDIGSHRNVRTSTCRLHLRASCRVSRLLNSALRDPVNVNVYDNNFVSNSNNVDNSVCICISNDSIDNNKPNNLSNRQQSSASTSSTASSFNQYHHATTNQ